MPIFDRLGRDAASELSTFPLRRKIGAAIIIIVLVLLWASFVTIGPGNRGVLMTFGAVRAGVLTPGLHFKLPFI